MASAMIAYLHYVAMISILALGSGAARVVWFGKGAAFYLHNPVFYIVELTLFALVPLMATLMARCIGIQTVAQCPDL